MVEMNKNTYSKVLILKNSLRNKIKQPEDEKKINEKVESFQSYRLIPRIKSAILFDAEKEIKKMTLSTNSFCQYMKKNKNNIRQYAFKDKKILAYDLIENAVIKNNQKIKSKKLPNVFYKKLGINEYIKNKNKEKEKEKGNIFTQNLGHTFTKDKAIKINKQILYDNKEDNDEEENNTVKEMPYGFKYKDTRIIFDKNKLGPIKSVLFPNNGNNTNSNLFDNNEFNNVTDFTGLDNFKKKLGKSFSNENIQKSEVEKNNTFKYFFEGDFLERNKNIMKNKNKSEILLKNEEGINYLNELYEICKNIEKFNAKDSTREMKYNLKKYYQKEDFAFDLNIHSLCLKFIKQNNLTENEDKKPQKIFLPFTYLLFFYLLDFETFKLFLSEIIIYNEEKEEMEINQREIRDVLIKYKKYIQFILGPFFNPNNKKDNKENKEKFQKATYNLNERNFLKIYDWIVHINSNNEEDKFVDIKNNKNIIYKVKIILPLIKFNLINRKIVVKKYIHKNIIINLLKTGLDKWEEKILSELFLNKKFRYLMNSILSQKQMNLHSRNPKKISLDRKEYNHNILYKHKYEFFITDAKKEHSRYFYISSYDILFFYGRKENLLFNQKKMNLKDCLNLYKFSNYWGYMDTLMKCLLLLKNENKVLFDFKILEKSPSKYFKIRANTSNAINEVDKSNLDNLKNFYQQGYMFYRREDLLIDIYLINFNIVEPIIIRLNFERHNYKIPKELLNIITTKKNIFNNINKYISEFSDLILLNKGILNLNVEDFKRRVFNKNLSKGMQERLKTFSLGLINKTNTLKKRGTNMDINQNNSSIKRGKSGSIFSLFGNSILNRVNSFKKSDTKNFGNKILINMEKIEEKKINESKKENKRMSIWKKFTSKKKLEEKDEIKEVKEKNEIEEKPQIRFFDQITNVKSNEIKNERDSIDNLNIKLKKIQKRESFVRDKYIRRASFFKSYIDDANKKVETNFHNIYKKHE